MWVKNGSRVQAGGEVRDSDSGRVVEERTLTTEKWTPRSLFRERLRLEDQPQAVCHLVGRLLDRLLAKGLLDIEDLRIVTDTKGLEELRTLPTDR